MRTLANSEDPGSALFVMIKNILGLKYIILEFLACASKVL